MQFNSPAVMAEYDYMNMLPPSEHLYNTMLYNTTTQLIDGVSQHLCHILNKYLTSKAYDTRSYCKIDLHCVGFYDTLWVHLKSRT